MTSFIRSFDPFPVTNQMLTGETQKLKFLKNRGKKFETDQTWIGVITHPFFFKERMDTWSRVRRASQWRTSKVANRIFFIGRHGNTLCTSITIFKNGIIFQSVEIFSGEYFEKHSLATCLWTQVWNFNRFYHKNLLWSSEFLHLTTLSMGKHYKKQTLLISEPLKDKPLFSRKLRREL